MWSTEFDKMAENQPFNQVLYEFGFAKFGQLRMFQCLNFEPLDMSNCTVITSSE